MSDNDSSNSGGGFEELTPSGRLRKRRRKHSGPYNAPLPEAADLDNIRLHPEDVGRQNEAPRVKRPTGPLPPTAEGEEPAFADAARELADDVEDADPKSYRQAHPADKIPPPLPAAIAVVNQKSIFDEKHGKRKRKRGSGDTRKCPFCHHNRAQHIRPANPFARLASILGIRTYSCRNCHIQHLGFSFMEGVHFTWRQVGVAALIVLLCLAVFAFIYPIFHHIPDPTE